MKFFVRTASGRTRSLLARVVACVLIGGIVHAVTFGAAHSHVGLGSSLNAGETIAASGQAGQAVPDPLRYRTDRQECLICLFHQQLFNSVVHTPFFVARHLVPDTDEKGDKLHKYSSSFISTPIARLSGRAPPRA